MMGHPVLVAPRQASCSTSQSLPPPSQDSLTPSEFAGAWLMGFFAFVLTMLLMVEWMPISALVFGRNWLCLSATHSGHFLVFQLSLAATLMSGGVHSTWAGRGTVIAPCFHIFTGFSKVVVFVFGTTSRGPHTVLERLSIWSSLLVALRAGSFIVHQGDECCSLSPLCSPALGSNHFLVRLSFSCG